MESTKIKLEDFRFIDEDTDKAPDILTTSGPKSKASFESESAMSSSLSITEDFSNLSRQFAQNIPVNENWSDRINFPARIIEKTQSSVTCECILDKENKIFEFRVFPKNLFSHLNIEINKPILINIKNKPGSTRIDIHDGEGLVDFSYFNVKDRWDNFRNSGLDKPFTGIEG